MRWRNVPMRASALRSRSETLDTFMKKHCGVANPTNVCRCAYQVDQRVARRALDPECLRLALPSDRTSLESLRTARREVGRVRRSLELYQAQPGDKSSEDCATGLRGMLDDGGMRIFDS